jgi:hypothetical protein
VRELSDLVHAAAGAADVCTDHELAGGGPAR